MNPGNTAANKPTWVRAPAWPAYALCHPRSDCRLACFIFARDKHHWEKYKKADCGDGEKNAKRQAKNTPRPILQWYKDNIGRTAGNNKTKGANQSQAISNPLSGVLSYRPQITIGETACQLLYDRHPPLAALSPNPAPLHTLSTSSSILTDSPILAIPRIKSVLTAGLSCC